jgi:DNA-binding FrmR family transcriptional regulator
MAEFINGHFRHHMNDEAERGEAAAELMQIVRSYFR